MYRQQSYMRMGEIVRPEAGLGQNPLLDSAVAALMPYAQQLGTVAAEKIQPVIKSELQASMPKFAAITGLVAGGLVIVGLILGKKLL
jgi:hypothetical protein